MTDRPDVYETTSTNINLEDAYNVMLWGLVLGVTSQTITAATLAVGADAHKVQAYLCLARLTVA
ncbi:MAG TPA: DUF3606 domain-containing protein [Luteibacter sp.]|jgi:hypothetical protein|uniref:DUF3606 domain-containing protein n=1 Tax=Luteibacter sp. TaxID=1886636 RepID=UPI002F42DED3